jgi:hypothetical protein
MTLLAVSTHLAAMDIRMAVSAIGSGIGEHGLGVTLGAGNSLMQSA